ncbi:unnamed protein product [marine sediment metagenome]|uniref:Uncharacterized protein n=1 Tax=marine sediment metagenome TaxID=412755 RepID=X0V9L4_9ZZZZ
MIHIPVFHEGTFRAMVLAARHGLGCFRHRGRYWEPVAAGRRFGLYREGPDWLAWIQERAEDYEIFFYSRLLHGHCGRDGIVRPRAHLRRARGGAYRRSDEVGGAPG